MLHISLALPLAANPHCKPEEGGVFANGTVSIMPNTTIAPVAYPQQCGLDNSGTLCDPFRVLSDEGRKTKVVHLKRIETEGPTYDPKMDEEFGGRVRPIRRNKMASPVSYPQKCGLDSPGYLCDPSRALSEEGRERIAALLREIESEVEDEFCAAGNYQVAVAISTHKDQGGRLVASGDKAVKEAKHLMDHWGVGFKACRNGVVLFLAMDDRKFGLYVGAGALHLMPASRREHVLNLMKGDLRAGRVDEAVTNAVMDIKDALQGYDTLHLIERIKKDIVVCAFCAAIYLVLVLMGLYICYRDCRRNYQIREVKKRLRRIDDEDARAKAAAKSACAKASAFEDKRCPICLEDFSDIPDPIVLPCGHKMCCGCGNLWFGKSNVLTKAGMTVCISKRPQHRCPVCRRSALASNANIGIDVNTDADDEKAGSRLDERLIRSSDGILDAQLFRQQIRRARHACARRDFSDVVTPEMEREWARCRRVEVTFANQIKAVDESSASSSSSFGGGFSFDGAGSGGGW